MAAANIIEEYLVSLGFSTDQMSVRGFKNTLMDAEKAVVSHTGGWTKKILEAQGAIIGAFTAVSAGIVAMGENVAMADQHYRLLAERMLTTKDVAQRTTMITDALGASIEEIWNDPELANQAAVMDAMIQKMNEGFGPNFQRNMSEIRNLRAEILDLEVAGKMLEKGFISALWEKLRPVLGPVEEKLQHLIAYLTENAPHIADQLATYAVPVLKITAHLLEDCWKMAVEFGRAFANIIAAFSGDSSMASETADLTKMGDALLYVGNKAADFADYLLVVETNIGRLAAVYAPPVFEIIEGAMEGIYKWSKYALSSMLSFIGTVFGDDKLEKGTLSFENLALAIGHIKHAVDIVMVALAPFVTTLQDLIKAAGDVIGLASHGLKAAQNLGTAMMTHDPAKLKAAGSEAVAGLKSGWDLSKHGAKSVFDVTPVGGVYNMWAESHKQDVEEQRAAARQAEMAQRRAQRKQAEQDLHSVDTKTVEAAKKTLAHLDELDKAEDSKIKVTQDYLDESMDAFGKMRPGFADFQKAPMPKLEEFHPPSRRASESASFFNDDDTPLFTYGGSGDEGPAPSGPVTQDQAGIMNQIINATKGTKVSPALALAIARQESGFHQQEFRAGMGTGTLESSAHALGIFQLLKGTAADMGVNPYDTAGNIKGGVKYLDKLLGQYGGDTSKAIAAYNMGQGALDKLIQKRGDAWAQYLPTKAGGKPGETMDYLAKVTGYMGGDAMPGRNYGLSAEFAPRADSGGGDVQQQITITAPVTIRVSQTNASPQAIAQAFSDQFHTNFKNIVATDLAGMGQR